MCQNRLKWNARVDLWSLSTIKVLVKTTRKSGRYGRQKQKLGIIGLLAVSFCSVLLFNAFAEDHAIPSIEINSAHADFDSKDAGAWKVTKAAKWTSKTTAEISFTIDSIAKPSGNDKDIILVLDNSSSMEENLMYQAGYITKLEGIQRNAEELIRNVLDNQDSKIALISFASEADIVAPFTNDAEELVSGLNSMVAYGSTNYYRALTKVEEVLQDYEVREGRDIVVLFVTDGYPVKQTPLEVLEYMDLKNTYPNLTINAVQYDMGETLVRQLVAISDNQFIVQNAAQLDKAMFNAASVPYYYTSFNVSDYVDTNYWTLSSADANLGTVNTNADEQSVAWDLGRYFRPGQETKPELKLQLDLKEEFHEADGYWPTNTRETVSTSILDGMDENISSTDTPILQHKYDVNYDANLPLGCTSYVTLPETTRYFVFDAVEIQGPDLVCEGYTFKGWEIATTKVSHINDDHFRMPAADLTLRGIWTKVSIDKSMNGTVHERVAATFDASHTVNQKMKRLSEQQGADVSNTNTTITAIVRANKLAADVDVNDDAYILSAKNSAAPIYGWFIDGTLYYYTDADEIFLRDGAGFFKYLTALNDISGAADWNTSSMTSMSGMFEYCTSLDNIDALAGWDTSKVKDMYGVFWAASSLTNIDGAANWDVSNVTSFSHTFYDTSLTNIDALVNWDTSSAENMSDMFLNVQSLTNIDGARNWDVSNVTNMREVFLSTRITNIDALVNWNTSKVTNMSGMFGSTYTLTNIDGAINWNTSKVTGMSGMFSNDQALENIDGARNWNTSKVTDMSGMFKNTKIVSIDALANWDTSKVTNMYQMFNQAKSLENIDGAINWNTSNVTNMSGMFGPAVCYYGATSSLTNIDGAINWDTSSVTNMYEMFGGASSLVNINGAINWNTSKVTNMREMFCFGRSLTNISGAAKWDVSNVTDMHDMFYSNSELEDINALENWNISSLTNMSGMFDGTKIYDLSPLTDWDVSNVTNMGSTFYGIAATNIDALAGWNMSNVTYMSRLFARAHSLTNIDGARNWDVSSVTDMSDMFYDTPITDINALAGWNTSSVTNMSNMFSYASSLMNINGASNWNVSSVTNMAQMFSYTSIPDIDALTNWTTSNVTNMSSMFSRASSLTNINGASNWNVSSVTNMSNMFWGCESLENVTGARNWDVSSVTTMDRMFLSDKNISDLSPLDNWETTNLENMEYIFGGIPESVTRPSWYQ